MRALMDLLFSFFLIFLFPFFCGERHAGLKRVLGSDQALVVDESLIPVVTDLIPSTGLLKKGDEACTVNYLGNQTALTAGHCLSQETCSQVEIFWLNEKMVLETGGTCQRILSRVYEKNGEDYTVFEVGGTRPRGGTEVPDRLELEGSIEVRTLGFRFSQGGGEFELIYQEKCSASPLVTRPKLWSHDCDLGPSNSGTLLFVQDKPIAMHLRNASGLNIAQPFRSMGAIF